MKGALFQQFGPTFVSGLLMLGEFFRRDEAREIGVFHTLHSNRMPRPTGRHSLRDRFRISLRLKILSLGLVVILFISSGPILYAGTAREAFGGSAGGTAGAANLQNAGAASAALTATRARESLQKSDASVAAMKALQSSARALMTPTVTPEGQPSLN